MIRELLQLQNFHAVLYTPCICNIYRTHFMKRLYGITQFSFHVYKSFGVSLVHEEEFG
jgi:hypothetical protein